MGRIVAGNGVELFLWGPTTPLGVGNQELAGCISSTFTDAADATFKSRITYAALDFNGVREGLRIEGDGSTVRIGVYGHVAAAQPPAYTVTNPTTTRNFDETAVTLTTLAQVVGTLIADFQSIGWVG